MDPASTDFDDSRFDEQVHGNPSSSSPIVLLSLAVAVSLGMAKGFEALFGLKNERAKTPITHPYAEAFNTRFDYLSNPNVFASPQKITLGLGNNEPTKDFSVRGFKSLVGDEYCLVASEISDKSGAPLMTTCLRPFINGGYARPGYAQEVGLK